MSSYLKNLVYTRDNCRLTFDQRCFYEKNGYIVIRKLISLDLLQKCSQRFDDIATGAIGKDIMTVMRDVSDRTSVNKIQDITQDEIFRLYIHNDPMIDIVEAITGPNVMAVHSMLIAKPPDSGAETGR